MTSQIIAHKTSDGKIFEDEALADEHESRLIALREVTRLWGRAEMPLVLSSFDASDLTEYLVNHRDEFIRALQGQDNVGDADDPPDPEDEDLNSDTDAEIEARAIEEALAEAGTPVLDANNMPVVFERASLMDDGPRADDDTPF